MSKCLFAWVALGVVLLCLIGSRARAAEAEGLVLLPPAGHEKQKHIVFLAGDEEYRSEEGLPMLAKIFSQRHGFKCTVLFAVDPDGTINPDNAGSLPGAESLDSADAIVMLLRFRAWPDKQMKHFVDAYNRGVPIIALRTSTHAFQFKEGNYQNFNDFGKRVLGEQWVSHWGKHKIEATRGVIDRGAKDDPILRGVTDIFGDTDVYEAAPPADAKILVRGQVLSGMKPEDAPANYAKKRADGVEQPINDPMMPVAWTRTHRNEAGNENKIFCTTMGAATDLQSEGLRRLILNAVYAGLGLEVPEKADVQYVGEFKPTDYGFKGYRKGLKPADHALGASPETPVDPTSFKLNPDDHIAIVGNALADRMQHFGWLETFLQARYPEHRLVFRNLAAAGDEVVTRHRSENFGTPDDWLTKTKADVVFAFFGFNESFRGEAGLDAFKGELDTYLKHLKSQNYSGKAPPRVVLFSPIAIERHCDVNFPDPGAINTNIQLYTDAMHQVASANEVVFVDLFAPSNTLFTKAAERTESLTLNGLYLNEAGDRAIAETIYRALTNETAPGNDIEKLRNAVNEKNAQWHARYRTVDGYNVYGGRSNLKFPSGGESKEITNQQVMQEEMSQRDVLTANRDKVVWSTALGKPIPVDDSNLPPVTTVDTNKPGDAPDKAHAFLSGEEAIAKIKPHANCKVNLFASEEQFPELVNPVQMAWDTKGRLWVSVWPSYPERTPTSKTGDSLLVLEDTDGDGRADKSTPFLSDLNCPTGFQFFKDGVLVMQAPDLWFVRDTDNDGIADTKERILMGLDSADSHHTTNSMALEPGGAVYLSDGIFHRTQVETALGPVRNNDGAIYRFEPHTGRFETHVAYNFMNPHGRVFDYWGNDLITDATGNNTYFGPAFSGKLDYPQQHPPMEEFWKRPSRPSPGTGLMTSKHFPEEFWGNLLNLNVIGFQGIYRVKIVEDGSGLRGESQPDLVSSDDPNFRPTAVNVGPDGAVYFADWHNPIIGHMQHHIRDPSRDHAHGRIYRLTYEGRDLVKAPRIDGESIPALFELLKAPENQTRELAKIELGKRDSQEVIAAVKPWIESLDPKDPAYEHHVMEALWVHQWRNVIDEALLDRMFKSSEPRARAQATRVLCYWRDRVPNVLPRLAAAANDEHPRVRLEAVRAASFFRSLEAVDAALVALKHPTDYYLDYVLTETLRQLDPAWREALFAGKPIAKDNPAGLARLIRGISSSDLLKLPGTPAVSQVLLSRADLTDAERHRVVASLAEQLEVSRPAALLETLTLTSGEAAKTNVVKLLPQILSPELQQVRTQLNEIADGDLPPSVRQYAWAAIATADESFDRIWTADSHQPKHLLDLLGSVPLVYDPFVRATAYDRCTALLNLGTDHAAPTSDVRQAAIRAIASVQNKEQATFITLATLIESGEEIPAAAAALRTLQRRVVDPEHAANMTTAIVEWAKRIPVEQRTSPEFLSATQYAEGLVALLPASDAKSLLSDLRALRVAAFVVSSVREQMRYDTPRLVVEAGKPFEITFVNVDLMPHNLVVLKPGARERVGKATMTMKPDQLDAQGRAFLPNDPDILAATKMIENGQRETLTLTAPDIEGAYEYVCTYPDHWRVMWGELIVTQDIDSYLLAHPESDVPRADVAPNHSHGH